MDAKFPFSGIICCFRFRHYVHINVSSLIITEEILQSKENIVLIGILVVISWQILNFLKELLTVLLMPAPVRFALSFEIFKIKLQVVWVIEPSAHIALAHINSTFPFSVYFILIMKCENVLNTHTW